MQPTSVSIRHSRRRALGRCVALAVVAVSSACRGDEAATGPGGTVDPGPSGTVIVENAATPSAVAAGTIMTAAPVASTAVTPGTPRPTAEAAAEATRQKAAEQAEQMPRFQTSFGVAGTQPGQIMLPFDVAVDGGGNVYVGDSTGVQLFDPAGSLMRRVGEGTVPMAEGVAVAPDGRLYVAGPQAQVLIFDAEGNPAGTLGQPGEQPGQLRKPSGLTVDGAGNVFVADGGNARVEKFGPDGRHLLTIGERGSQSGQFTAPRVVAVDSDGRIYVGSGDDFLVQRFNPDGTYLDTFGQGSLDENLFRTSGIAIDTAGGRIYVSQSMSHAVQAFDLADPTRYLGAVGGRAGMSKGEFNGPGGIEVHDGQLFVADTRNNRVQTFTLPEPAR